MTQVVTSFREIHIDYEKTLIICDIDDTVLKWDSEHASYFASDLAGFIDMLRRLHSSSGSDLIFLSARLGSHYEYTRRGLAYAGLPTMYRMFFTDGILSKGEYILRNIPWRNYDKTIFIDDSIINIMSVNKKCPAIITYHWI